MYYRWTETSGTARVPRRRLLDLRVSIFEARVLSQSLWSDFQIWGCGRDARNFIAALSENAKKKIIAIVDIDEKKIGKICNNLPIEHFSAARRGVCTVVCVSKRRKGTISKDVDDELIENVSALAAAAAASFSSAAFVFYGMMMMMMMPLLFTFGGGGADARRI